MDRHPESVVSPPPIIAFALIALPTSLAAAESATAIALPTLGNTPELDRPLLREIGDDFVGDGVGTGTFPGTAEATAVETSQDAWSRVRAARRLVVPETEAVLAQRRRLLDEALWIGRMLRRADPYIAHVVEALDRRYLPLELALLPAIESGFRPRAISRRRASGLWQLMPPTAREFGVPLDDWYDGRGDVIVSTRAALDYLSYLNATFHGDWELTLAAYNAGPGRVRRALSHVRSSGGPSDFRFLPLPRETREYVPKFFALLSLLRAESGDALDLPRVPLSRRAFVEVDVRQRIDLVEAAELSGVPAGLLADLNAGLTRGVTPPDGPHRLNLPHTHERRFLAALARRRAARGAALEHEVVAGDTLGGIAWRYGVPERRLREANGLESSLIRVGQRLEVPPSEEGTRIEHVVSGGETLSGIARRYAVSVEDILDPDGERLDGDIIHPGQTLLVRPPAAAAGAAGTG